MLTYPRLSSKTKWLGAGYAFLAAACNGTVGIFSRFSFAHAMNYQNIAFWRCFTAFILLSLISLCRTKGGVAIRNSLNHAWQLAIAAFLGLFILYHYETYAFVKVPIPLVSILVFGGSIFAVILDIFILQERFSTRKLLAIALILGGSFLLINHPTQAGWGMVYAVVAGIGYGGFVFVWKLFRLMASLANLWWFFLFGTLFLFIPFFIAGHALPSLSALPTLLGLTIIPSLGGFLFTILSLKYIEAYKTQVIESSEPIFTALFAFIIFNEFLNSLGIIGASIILIGAILIALPER